MILGVASATYKYNYNLKEIAENKDTIRLIVNALKESMNVLKELNVTIVPRRNRKLDLFPGFLLHLIFKKLIGSDYAEIAIAGHARAAREEMRALADGFLIHCQRSGVNYSSFKKITSYI